MVNITYVELGLVIGGLIAIMSAVYGRKEQSSWDEVLLFLGFITGIAMIVIGVLIVSGSDYAFSTKAIMLLLGASLFLKSIKGIKIAALIALIAGGIVGYALYWAAKTYAVGFLSTTVIVIIAFVVMIIIYLLFKFLEDLLHLGGFFLGFRPLQFVMGAAALVEAALILNGMSIWQFVD